MNIRRILNVDYKKGIPNSVQKLLLISFLFGKDETFAGERTLDYNI